MLVVISIIMVYNKVFCYLRRNNCALRREGCGGMHRMVRKNFLINVACAVHFVSIEYPLLQDCEGNFKNIWHINSHLVPIMCGTVLTNMFIVYF